MEQHILFIRIDPPSQGFFTPGDQISGQICLRHFQLSALGRLDVALEGNARANCDKSSSTAFGSQHLRSAAPLVSCVKRITSSETLPPGDLASWPFSLKIPKHVQVLELPQDGAYKGVWNSFHKADGFPRTPANNSERLPLPPTFKSRSEYSMDLITLGIEYAVTARASISGRVLDAKKSFRIVTAPPVAESLAALQMRRARVVERCRARSLRLLPAAAERELSLREKTRELFKSSSIPQFIFNLHLEIAKHHCMGDKIPVLVRVEPIESMLPETPLVKLSLIRARLRANTVFRVATSFGYDVREKTEVIKDWSVSSDETFPEQEGYELRFSLPPVSLKKLSPSFSTMNVRRSYKMEITATVQCAGGGSHEVKCETVVMIYGPRRGLEREVLSPSLRDMRLSWLGGATEDELPSYEVAIAQGARRAGG